MPCIRLPFCCLLFLSIQACSIHEINTDPKPTLSTDSFTVAQDTEQNKTVSLTGPWWESLKDEKLKSLIEKAFANNLDLAQAKSRIVQAESYVTQASAARLPLVDLGARSSQQWGEDGGTESRHQFGGFINWEIDILGRLKNSLSAKEYELEKAIYEYDLAKLLLSSTIATTYYQAIEQKRQLSLLDQQLKTDKELLELTKRRFRAGIASRVDVLQQSGQLAETKSLIPSSQAAFHTIENRLDILLGQIPSGLTSIECGDDFPSTTTLPDRGVPSDLLLNRPDLRAKKAMLIAADAELGRAVLDRFPVVQLFTEVGTVTGNGATGFSANILSSLVQPILDWGLRKAEVKRRDAIYQERLLDYTQSYITAIAEVENLLFQTQKQIEFISVIKERISILESTVEETRRRYTGGLTDYLPVLDAVQQLRVLQRELLIQNRILATNQTQLFVALAQHTITADKKE